MRLGVTLDILNQKGTPAFFADTLANRPAAGFTGRVFISTDTLDLYRDTGTTWVLLSPSSTGTITGSGAAGQVTYFSGASSITGDNNLFWDSVNGHLGIKTITPDCALDVNHAGTFVAKFNNTTTANTLIGIYNLDNPQWLIGSNSVANDLTFYDATNFPTLVATTTMKTNGTTFIGGQTTGSGRLNVYSATGDNGIQISGPSAPSLRIDNAPTGATKRIGLGISTATNNFIQGSTDRDMCIFNGSTTPSPILFGINSAGVVNEAARISSAFNLLVGGIVDNGRKLQVTGDASFSTNGLFGGSNNPGNAGTYTISVGVPATTAGGIQLWAATNQSSFLQFGDGTASADNYRGFVGYNHNTDTLSLGTASADKLTISSTGAATFSSNVSVNGLATSANYKLGASGRAYFSGLNDKGLFISDSNSPAYVSLVGLNSAISAYNNVELRASGTDGQLYLTTAGNVVVGSTTDAGQKLQVNGIAKATSFRSITGTQSIASLATTTIYTIPTNSTADGMYFVQVEVTSGSAIYMASGVVTALAANGEAFFTSFYDGANVTLSVSGLNIQVTNQGFSTFTWNYSILFQSNN